MIVDTSAIIAVLKREPGYELLLDLLLTHRAQMSAPVLVETRIVVSTALGTAGRRRLEVLIEQSGIEIVPFDMTHADAAAEAYRDYGRGSGHPARLNLADSYSFALAHVADEPLLYVGDDFSHTDIRSALEEYGE